MQSQSQIELNIMRALATHVKEVYANVDEDDGQHDFIAILDAYEKDFSRIMAGIDGDLNYLCDVLKPAFRSAAKLMGDIYRLESASLENWYVWQEPRNRVQLLFAFLEKVMQSLATSILEVETQYPEMQHIFDAERELYRRCHEQWQREDEAETIQ
jgi:hypothetical protein